MRTSQCEGFPQYKKNDVVQVISGKHKGKKGKILRMLKSKGLVVVEKINIVKRHTKGTQQNPKSEIVEKEAPMHVSKILPISKSCKPVRVAVWLKENPRDKKKVRGGK